MKWIVLAMLGALSLQAEAVTQLKTQEDKVSYGIGVSVIRNLKKQGSDLDINLIIQGIKDAAAGRDLPVSEKELRKVMNLYQNEIRQKMQLSRRIALEDNKKAEEAYLAKHKTEEGVVALPNGLQYKILKAGNGPIPTDMSQVLCNYRGTLLDGTEFDGTDEGHPASLKISSMIAGWKAVMKLMPEGSKWQIAIPASLAYGERGAGADIGPNQMLLFDVELLAVKN